ncbi:MAG TPA: SDR family oxidoreductase [Acidimicrobiales bacterium]|nr:SDR family oxidoreductase [Acidimicrobiales bacterium]
MPRPRALVTGASSGIGLAFARQLARGGYDLVVVARSAGRLHELAEELKREHGAETEVLTADLSADAGIAAVEARLAAATGPVDVLVNNAGVGTFGRFVDLPIASEIDEIELNVVALVRLTRAVLPGLIERGTGGVINVASLAAYQPGPFEATYCATKAFVNSFSQAVHEEVRGAGVTVLSLCPGFTITEFQERGGADTSKLPSFASQTADEVVTGALKAFRRGRAVHIPGGSNKVLVATARLSPQRVARKMAAMVGRRLARI